MSPIETAVDVCGGQAALASAIEVSQQHIWNWINRAKGRVPAEYCPAIERETAKRGRAVRCEDLRPDVDWAVLRTKGAPRVPDAAKAT